MSDSPNHWSSAMKLAQEAAELARTGGHEELYQKLLDLRAEIVVLIKERDKLKQKLQQIEERLSEPRWWEF